MGWGPIQGPAVLSGITTRKYFDADVLVSGDGYAYVSCEVDFPESNTSDAILSIHGTYLASGTISGASETVVGSGVNIQPDAAIRISKNTDPNRAGLPAVGPPRFRVGIERGGGSSTLTTATLHWVVWTP